MYLTADLQSDLFLTLPPTGAIGPRRLKARGLPRIFNKFPAEIHQRAGPDSPRLCNRNGADSRGSVFGTEPESTLLASM